MGKYMIRVNPRDPHYDEVFGKERSMAYGPCKEFGKRELNGQ